LYNPDWNIIYTCLATILVNLPFGYWRSAYRKFSFWWFVAIYFPVPLVVIIRKSFDLQLSFTLAPLLFGSFFIGQFAGKKLYAFVPWKKP